MRKFFPSLLLVLMAIAGCSGPVIISDTISPTPTVALDAGQSVTFTAAVQNDPSNSGVTWSVTGLGTLSNVTTTSATYTAPATVTAAASATVQAVPVKNTLYAAATLINYGAGLVFPSTTLAPGTIGTAYSTQLATSGGVGTLTFTLTSGALPTGLTLSSAGVISGNPSAATSSTFTVRVTDSAATPASATATLTLNISGTTLVISTTTVPNGVATKAYSTTLTATGGATPYAWTIASGALPTGLALSSAGVLSGTPTSTGTFTFGAKVTDTEPSPQTATRTYTFIVYAPLVITTTTLPNGSLKNAYSTTLAYTGGTTPVTFSLATGSSLPAGLSLSTAGVISGTPATAGNTTFTVQLADTSSPQQVTTATYTLTILSSTLAITTTTLPQGTQTVAYNATLTSSGGNPPVTWALAANSSLPAGLTLSTAGVISGTPTAAAVGTNTFTVQATDTTPYTVSQTLSITVVALQTLTITTTTLPAGNIGTAYSSTLAAAGGAVPYTWSVTGGTLPVGLTLSTAGVLSGTPLAAGSYTFTVQVKDSEATPITASRSFTVVIGTTLATGAGNAELTGSYAFLINGFLSGNASGKVYGFGAIGSLTFSGAGVVTGIEDLNTPTGVTTAVAVTGTYSLATSGRGLMVLTSGTTTTVYAIAVSNFTGTIAHSVALTEFDNTGTGATATGFARFQTNAAFTAASFKGTYAFGLSGESPCSTCATPAPKFGPIAAVGLFTSDGGATLSAGAEDAAAYGTNYSGITLAGSFTAPSSMGRGTLKLTPTGTLFTAPPSDFTYVIVNASELLLLSNDTHATTSLLYGDVQLQQQASYTAASFSGRSIGYESQASGGDGSITFPTALNALLTEFTNTGSGTATFLQDANRAGTFTAGTATAVTYTTATNGRTVITTGGTNEVLYLYNAGAGFALDQAATTAYPALAQYELQVPTSTTYPPFLNGTYAASTLANPVATTISSSIDVFVLDTGGVNGGISGTLATTTDSSTPTGTLTMGQTASLLYLQDFSGRAIETASTYASSVAIVDAITSTRAISIPTTAATTPTVTILQQ